MRSATEMMLHTYGMLPIYNIGATELFIPDGMEAVMLVYKGIREAEWLSCY